MYLNRADQIGFQSDGDQGDDWVRADADPEGVTFDRGGICRLNRKDCTQLAEWLLKVAAKLDPPAPAPIVKRRRRRSKNEALQAVADCEA